MLTNDAPSSSAFSSAAQSGSPFVSTPITRTSWPSALSASKAARTEGCSTALTATVCLPRMRVTAPSTARLLASVPPEVNTSSQPAPRRGLSTFSRASRSRLNASTEGLYTDEGLYQPSRRHSLMACIAASQGRVVAELSR